MPAPASEPGTVPAGSWPVYAAAQDEGGLAMVDVDGSRNFEVSADALWTVVADPARLSDWVPTMRLAEPAGRAEVHIEGESHGHPYSLTSMLRADPDGRRLHWGGSGDDGYGGSLEVVSALSGSELHMHVAIPGNRLPDSEDAVAEIRRGMDEAFDRLDRLIAS